MHSHANKVLCTSNPDISLAAINHIHILMKSSFQLGASLLRCERVTFVFITNFYDLSPFFSTSYFCRHFIHTNVVHVLYMQQPREGRKKNDEKKLVEKSKPSTTIVQCNENNRHKMKLEISRKIIKPTLLIHIQTFLALSPSPFSPNSFMWFVANVCTRLIDELWPLRFFLLFGTKRIYSAHLQCIVHTSGALFPPARTHYNKRHNKNSIKAYFKALGLKWTNNITAVTEANRGSKKTTTTK